MTPIETVIARLEDCGYNPRRSGDGWSAHCPAHDDRKPSLWVTEGNDGWVRLKCYAGCDRDRIVAALGLQISDLGPARERRLWVKANGKPKTNGKSEANGEPQPSGGPNPGNKPA